MTFNAPLYVGASSLDEFDQWESDWRAGLELSGRPEALELAHDRRREYLEIYRGMLRFAWLILLRASTTAARAGRPFRWEGAGGRPGR